METATARSRRRAAGRIAVVMFEVEVVVQRSMVVQDKFRSFDVGSRFEVRGLRQDGGTARTNVVWDDWRWRGRSLGSSTVPSSST